MPQSMKKDKAIDEQYQDQLAYDQYLSNKYVHERMLDEENDRPSWTDIYLKIAGVVATRSKDPHTKVGAVLVKDGGIIGIGYNGEPRGFSFKFDWTSKEKYDYVIHAEANAITNACSAGVSCVGASIYITSSPCHECMKLIIQHRLKAVYFIDKYIDFELTERLARYSNVNLIQLPKAQK